MASAVIFIIIIFAMLAEQLPIGVDYHFTFRPAARDWVDGKTQLYDENGHGFFNAQGALILLVPLSRLSFVAGSYAGGLSKIDSISKLKSKRKCTWIQSKAQMV